MKNPDRYKGSKLSSVKGIFVHYIPNINETKSIFRCINFNFRPKKDDSVSFVFKGGYFMPCFASLPYIVNSEIIKRVFLSHSLCLYSSAKGSYHDKDGFHEYLCTIIMASNVNED